MSNEHEKRAASFLDVMRAHPSYGKIEDNKRKRALKLIDKQLEGEPVYTKPAPEDFRCFNCRSEPTCPSAWDLYNTGGDCLEEK